MPPSVQWLCVAGSGPKVRPCCSAASRRSSSTHAGLHPREPPASESISRTRFMYFEKSMTHRDVAALAGEARAAAARQDRRAVRAADGDGRDHVVDVARDDDADRHLAIVRGVGRVERAAAARRSAPRRDDRCAQFARASALGVARRSAPAAARRAMGVRRGVSSRCAVGSEVSHSGSLLHVSRVAFGVRALELQPEPGPRQVRARARRRPGVERAVEQHLLDAHVIVEVLDVPDAAARRSTACACSDGAHVGRERQRERLAQRADAAGSR